MDAPDPAGLSPADARLVLEQAPDGILVVDGDGRVVHANAEALRLFGYRREELIGARHDLLVPAALRERHRDHQRHYLELPTARRMGRGVPPPRGRRADGSEFPAEISISPLLDGAPAAGGTAQRLIVFVRDETPLRAAHDRLRRLQELSAALVGANDVADVADVIFSVGAGTLGASMALLALVTGGGELLEITHDTALGAAERESWARAFATFPTPGPRPTGWLAVSMGADTPLVECVREARPVYLEDATAPEHPYPPAVLAALALHGHRALACLPLCVSEGGAAPRAIGGLRFCFATPRTFDADERAFLATLADQCALALHRCRLHDETRAAGRAAGEAIRMRDQFLAVIGHELRHPLAAMTMWERVLRNESADAATRHRALAALRAGMQVQSRMVEDLLDASRAMQGLLRVDHAHLALWPVVRAAFHEAAPLLEQAGLRGRLDVEELVDGRGETVVRGDEVRLRQVLTNLLSNAVKFTPAGGHVEVRARRIERWLEVTVADDGRGFAPEHAEALFEPFVQASSGGVGLGLGLTTARQIVQLHGGTLVGESDGPGRGARFRVRLPLAPIDEGGADRQSHDDGQV